MQRDHDVVSLLEQRQRTHPPLDGLPLAAQILELPLFLGEARAAQVASVRLVALVRY